MLKLIERLNKSEKDPKYLERAFYACMAVAILVPAGLFLFSFVFQRGDYMNDMGSRVWMFSMMAFNFVCYFVAAFLVILRLPHEKLVKDDVATPYAWLWIIACCLLISGANFFIYQIGARFFEASL